jgi:CTP synthase
MSGLGKGIFSSSLAKLLQDWGLKVAPIKLEGYLNVDSGTLNPFRHGEVFVLDDGMECDMDLGAYERILDQDLTRFNFATSGQIFTRVLEKERQGSYLGHDVQMIPHVTGEVKSKLRELAMSSDADVVFVEIGGTVGDVENAYFIEAVRELAFEEGPSTVCFVALTYVLEPAALGEQKSKPAQLGIKRLNASGIQPHVIACRAGRPVTRSVREKIAMFGNVPLERVFSMHDCESIYLIPRMIRDSKLDEQVVKMLGLEECIDEDGARKGRAVWEDFVDRLQSVRKLVELAITGKYTGIRDSYASILMALEHCSAWLDCKINLRWIDTTGLDDRSAAEALDGVHGIIVPGGFGVRGTEGKISCIKHAREQGLPFLGLCLGFQMAVVEFARHVCGLDSAGSTEFDRECVHPVISTLPQQRNLTELGGTMRLGGKDIEIKPGTKAGELYGNAPIRRLRFRHRYEVDPRYIERLEADGMIFSGKAPNEEIMQILELVDHPFFMATQAHGEMTSRPLRPEPMFVGLVEAAVRRAESSDFSESDGQNVVPAHEGR